MSVHKLACVGTGFVVWVFCGHGLSGAETNKPAPIAVEIPPAHPRLLLHREDLVLLKSRCGLGESRGPGRPGRTDADAVKVFQSLDRWVDGFLDREPSAGFLYSPALLHLLTGQPGKPDRYSQYVARQLLSERPRVGEGDDEVIALDWCWDAIDPSERAAIVVRLLGDARPLAQTDSPFQHFSFFPKLRALATVLTAYGQTLGRVGKAQLGEEILEAAGAYLEGPFIDIFNERGALGTSPSNGLYEDADAAFAAEIWQTGTGRPIWARLRPSLGRACEAYFYGLSDGPGLDHGFYHDDGTFVPQRPSGAAQTPAPILPWVVGHRTEDPFAGWLAGTVLAPGVLDLQGDPLSRHWWARLVYQGAERRRVDRQACPLARHFGGGWVVMRSGFSAGATRVLLDVGQPIFRSRQHFDAGHFVIYRKGCLTQGSGQDVSAQAVPTKGGMVKAGEKESDWDFFFQSAGAHNCVTVLDRLYRQKRYGKWWGSGGGQRIVDKVYRPADGRLADTGRVTGRLTAFQSEPEMSYAACDLARAYPSEIVTAFTRQFLFLHAGLIVVIDRLTTTKPDQIPRWNLQLVGRPSFGGGSFPARLQVQGKGPDAGIWVIDAPSGWLRVDDGAGSLYVKTILPFDGRWRILGGPKEIRVVRKGRHAGTPYVGGSEASFEHWIYPPRTSTGVNVWYRLGRPSGLGPHFQLGANWGRLEVESTDRQTGHVFAHVLVPTDRDKAPPEVTAEIDETTLSIQAVIQSAVLSMKLSIKGAPAGEVTAREEKTDRVLWKYELASAVAPDAKVPLQTR